ncbi:MAG: terminase small subunit [Eubacteriales bacterium]
MTQSEKKTFVSAYLKTMDATVAAQMVGLGDGVGLLSRADIQDEVARQRQTHQILPQDVTRRMQELAFGRANDCVKLALEEGYDLDSLDLTLLSEIKRTDKGMVEIKLVDRMKALEFLAAQTGAKKDAAAEFFAAMGQVDGT